MKDPPQAAAVSPDEMAEALVLLVVLRRNPALLRELLEDILARDLVPLWTEVERIKARIAQRDGTT